jgi:exosortase D (VPLPA-CTERM-specific)
MIKSSSRKAWLFSAGSVLFIALAYSYWDIIHGLVNQWASSEDYSHGFFILPISAFLAWQKRSELKTVRVGTDWRGVLILLLGVLIFAVGELGAELFTTRFSFLVSLIGVLWLLCGWAVVKVLRFPLAFLFMMLPLPGFIYRNITFPLQLWSSKWSVQLMQALGMSVYREGNIIDLKGMQLQVVEACSGLRYLLPLTTLSLVLAYLGHRSLWKRCTLVLGTIPIAILSNVLRIAGTGIIAQQWGRQTAEGFLHDFSGWAVFMASFAFFLLLSCILKWLPDSDGKESAGGVEHSRVDRQYNPSWAAVLAGAAVILATPPLVEHLGSVKPVTLQQPLSSFPLQLGNWAGTRSSMDPEMWQQVGGQDYVIINYQGGGGAPINFYVAYYEYQRKAGDFIHSPRLCLPGSGWFIESNVTREITAEPDGGRSGSTPRLKLNELVIEKGGVRQLTYFWYQGRGRNFTSEYAAKFYMVWDGIWKRRTDGALVRLVAPVARTADLDRERKILDDFALGVATRLKGYLP